jgi:type IV pilus assembly protein PilQ
MKNFSKSKLLGLVTILTLAIAAYPAEVTEEAEGVMEDAGQKEILTTLEQRMLKKISIDFRNTPIDDVIRIMADQADVDIVKSPQVTGNVTATLTNVPLEEALDNVLAAHGFGYVTGTNMIRIAPVGEIDIKAEKLDSKVYHITYANVTEVEKALAKFISGRGSLSSNPGTSHIIVTDTETNIKAINTFIEEIDKITPQVLIETRVYDITSRDRLDLGVEWDAGRRTKTDPFIFSGFEGGTNKTQESTLGFFRFGILNDHVDIDMQLRAEEENIDAKLLANPRILVLDNETAFFDIVTENPYIERTISGDIITETVKFKNVGVKLEVTPHVTREGMLRLHIQPEFSVVVSRVVAGSSDVPVVDTRKMNTIALVEHNQTVVLGGLRKKESSIQINKIPLLGDLPVLGGLFKFEGDDTVTNELVVFLTPYIIKRHPTMSESERNAYQVTEFDGPPVKMSRFEEPEEGTSEE